MTNENDFKTKVEEAVIQQVLQTKSERIKVGMKKAKETLHIYVRVSTNKQLESLENQKKVGIETAQRLGMNYEIHEEGVASSDSVRPVFNDLLDQIKDKKIKYLFVYSLDRLFRSNNDLDMFYDLFSDVELYTKEGKELVNLRLD